MPVNEGPITNKVDDISRYQRQHDRNHNMYRLQIAAQSEIAQQGQCAPVQGRQERTHGLDQFTTHAKAAHQRWREGHQYHENWRQRERQEESVYERVAGIPDIVASMGLSDKRIKTKQQSCTENGDAVIETLAEPVAPLATALFGRRPTMIVSTTPMLIQPISARTKGSASRRVGQTSSSLVRVEDMNRLLCRKPRGRGNKLQASGRHFGPGCKTG
jgi:hypothetical protein